MVEYPFDTILWAGSLVPVRCCILMLRLMVLPRSYAHMFIHDWYSSWFISWFNSFGYSILSWIWYGGRANSQSEGLCLKCFTFTYQCFGGLGAQTEIIIATVLYGGPDHVKFKCLIQEKKKIFRCLQTFHALLMCSWRFMCGRLCCISFHPVTALACTSLSTSKEFTSSSIVIMSSSNIVNYQIIHPVCFSQLIFTYVNCSLILFCHKSVYSVCRACQTCLSVVAVVQTFLLLSVVSLETTIAVFEHHSAFGDCVVVWWISTFHDSPSNFFSLKKNSCKYGIMCCLSVNK